MSTYHLSKNDFIILSEDKADFSIEQREITKIIKKENITLLFFKKEKPSVYKNETPAVLIISRKLKKKALATGHFLREIKLLLKEKNDNKLYHYCESQMILSNPKINIFDYFDNFKVNSEKAFLKAKKNEFFNDWANSDELHFPVSSSSGNNTHIECLGDICTNIDNQEDISDISYLKQANNFKSFFLEPKLSYKIKRHLELSKDFNVPTGFQVYISSKKFDDFITKSKERRYDMNTNEFISLITKPFNLNIGIYHKSTKIIIPVAIVESKMGFDTLYENIEENTSDNYSCSDNFPTNKDRILELFSFYQISLLIDELDFEKSLSWAKEYFFNKKERVEEKVSRISEYNAQDAFSSQLKQFASIKEN